MHCSYFLSLTTLFFLHKTFFVDNIEEWHNMAKFIIIIIASTSHHVKVALHSISITHIKNMNHGCITCNKHSLFAIVKCSMF